MLKIFGLIAAAIVPLIVPAQQNFNINGSIGGHDPAAKVFLSYRVGNESFLDSAVVKNGRFQIQGIVESITAASLRLRHDLKPLSSDPRKRLQPDVLQIYLEEGTINISTTDSLKNAKVEGGPVNTDNNLLLARLKPLSDKINALNSAYRNFTPAQRSDSAFMEAQMSVYRSAVDATKPVIKEFVQQNRDSYIALISWLQQVGPEPDPGSSEPEFLAFTDRIRETPEAKKFREILEDLKKTRIGLETDFAQTDQNGKIVRLSDFRGKYVLVDFWASWCGPCREENPNLVTVFNRFKDKNFTMISVSLDQPNARAAWLQAIKDDGLVWTQLSDLRFWDNTVAKQYGVSAIPFSLLIDPTGKIIDKQLKGTALADRLAGLLGK